MHLKHTALYAKHHYKRSGDLIADLKITLEADGYMAFNKYDIRGILLSSFQKIPDHSYDRMGSLIDGIAPYNVWKVGYYTKGNCNPLYTTNADALPDYDYDLAVIMYIISCLCYTEVKDLNGLPKADASVLDLSEYAKTYNILEK